MSAEVSGAVERLIYLLEKHFSPVGNPPQMPAWSFAVDEPRDDPAGFLGERGVFGALIEDEPTEAIREAIGKIPPLAEVAEALKNLCAMIETNGDRSEWHHLRDAFLRLANSDWVESIDNGSSYDDSWSHHFGYVFAAVDRQLLAELRESARRITLTIQPPPTDPITLREMATLGMLSEKTVSNWGSSGRPQPIVTAKGRIAAVYSYSQLRQWFAKQRPDLSYCWPESFEQARTTLNQMSSRDGTP